MSEDGQTTPGRTQPCCICLSWAVSCGYIKKGYAWWRDNKPIWVPWTFRLKGEGWIETSPIHFCPFSGHNLDKPED